MSLGALLAERERRRVQAGVTSALLDRFERIARDLRSWFYPEQAAFFSSPAKRKATVKTRRAGATSGACHELLARAFGHADHRLVYCNEVREEAKRLAWRADTKEGLVDILERLASEGRIVIGQDRRDFAKGADVKIDEQALTIDFRNGSQIRVFAADDPRSQERGRGAAPHVVMVDEAQKMPNLRNLVDAVFGPSMTDHDGEFWLVGTPSEWLDGYFHDVTQPDIEARVKGWEIHTLTVSMNVFYGATPEERWARTAGAELERNGWDIDHPPASFQREWLAMWVRTDARMVYSIQRWPNPIYAPLRTTPIVPAWMHQINPDGNDPAGISGAADRWYDHAASVRDLPLCLPETTEQIEWFFGLGVDFGYNPDPFAVVLWAFSPAWPTIYEMFSWQRTLILPDWQRDCVRWFFDNIAGLVYADGDPGGQAGANMEGWRELLGIPIDDAAKAGKRTWIELMNNDGERGRIKLRSGSPLGHGMHHLGWKKVGQKLVENADRRLSDGTVPGNHSQDSALYAYRRYVSRRTDDPTPPPRPGSLEWLAAEEKAMRDAAAATSTRMLAEQDDGAYGSY